MSYTAQWEGQKIAISRGVKLEDYQDFREYANQVFAMFVPQWECTGDI